MIQIILVITQRPTFHLLILLLFGIFCAIGDILLGIVYINNLGHRKIFLLGILSFSVAHLFLTGLLFSVSEIRWITIVLPICAEGVLIYIEKNKAFQFGKMKVFVRGYGFLVTLILAQCIVFSVDNFIIFPMLGAFLFWISDFMLVFLYFYKRPWKTLRGWNLFFYYAGIEILIMSLAKMV